MKKYNLLPNPIFTPNPQKGAISHCSAVKVRFMGFRGLLLLPFTFYLFTFLPFNLFSQNITAIDSYQEGKNIKITYTLDKTADISVYVSLDGGKTYGSALQQVTGHVGKNIAAGNNTITWNVLAEREQLKGDNIVFKVETGRAPSNNSGGNTQTFTANGVSFEMIFVKGGTFTMGCTNEQGSDCESDEKPAHQVTLSDYYMGKFEVTQKLWVAVMGTSASLSNPSYFKGDNLPVENVSWNDSQNFITKLNQLTGKNFTLPTEAQWEFAARGGASASSATAKKYSGSNNIDDVAWYSGNSGSKTHVVGTKLPNALDIYDISGNVWEWCSDWYGSYSSTAQTNPTGASSASSRVRRGGSWSGSAGGCRVSPRYSSAPDDRYNDLGFRLVLSQ